MRTRILPAPGVPESSLIDEMRQDALDAHKKIGMCCACGRCPGSLHTVVIDTNVGPCEMCHNCADEFEGMDE